MRTKTEIKRMMHELEKEVIRGCHWFNLSLKWLLGEKQDIRGHRLTKSDQKLPMKTKAEFMIHRLKVKGVWRASYFIQPLEWALGLRDDIFGHELSKEDKIKCIFS